MLRRDGHHPDDGAIVFVMSVVPNENGIDGQHNMKTAIVARADLWPNEDVVNRIVGYSIPHVFKLIGFEPEPKRNTLDLSAFFSVN